MNASPLPETKILVVEDDVDIRNMLSKCLTSAGFGVLEAADGAEACEIACTRNPDLVLLDIMLPKMTGNEVCKVLRAHSATVWTPIIMLTARTDEIDRVLGFELGVDDYVIKPFSPRELLLRIRAVLRRGARKTAVGTVIESEGLQLDRQRREVHLNGARLALTSMEFKLLMVLMERAGALQTRDSLLKDVWNYQSDMDTRTVDTHIRRLREKLGTAASLIKTLRGVGYSFNGSVSRPA